MCNWQGQRELGLQLLLQPGYIPLLFNAHWWDKTVNSVIHHIPSDRGNRLANPIVREQLITLTVNYLALVISHIIVFEQLLSNVEVSPFNLPLGFFDSIGNHAVLDSFAPLHAKRLHEAFDPVRGEDTHQIIF